jgi:hypothetical protein
VCAYCQLAISFYCPPPAYHAKTPPYLPFLANRIFLTEQLFSLCIGRNTTWATRQRTTKTRLLMYVDLRLEDANAGGCILKKNCFATYAGSLGSSSGT